MNGADILVIALFIILASVFGAVCGLIVNAIERHYDNREKNSVRETHVDSETDHDVSKMSTSEILLKLRKDESE